jgi:hypothetical protein
MPSTLVRLVSNMVVNAVSLGLAAWLFDGFTVTIVWFVVVVLAYSVAGFFLSRLRLARRSAIAGGLLLSFGALVITSMVIPGSDFQIDGWLTWVGVTVLVWAAGVAYGEVDRNAPADAPGRSVTAAN